MEKRNEPLTPEEEKEQKAIAWENNVLSILMPSVGLVLFLFGFIGFILVIPSNVGIAIFLLVLAILGGGGIAYGVLSFLKRRKNRSKKEDKEPEKKK